jgi:hypothetical protein
MLGIGLIVLPLSLVLVGLANRHLDSSKPVVRVLQLHSVKRHVGNKGGVSYSAMIDSWRKGDEERKIRANAHFRNHFERQRKEQPDKACKVELTMRTGFYNLEYIESVKFVDSPTGRK